MANYTFPNIPDLLQEGDVVRFSYTGDVQKLSKYRLLLADKIKLECYGGAGGAGSYGGGQGGYTYGELSISSIPSTVSNLYFVVGGKGIDWGTYRPDSSTFGGGGYSDGGCGGGASDVRTEYNASLTYENNPNSFSPICVVDRLTSIDKATLATSSLKSRIIVAAGGGAGDSGGKNYGPGGAGGAWEGAGGKRSNGGTQSSGGWGNDAKDYPSGLGYGSSSHDGASGGGGGGYYGGGAGDGGGGGSSYVSGNSNCPTKASSGITLSNSGAQRGGNTGNGYIILTVLSGGQYIAFPSRLYGYKKSIDTKVSYPIYHEVTANKITKNSNFGSMAMILNTGYTGYAIGVDTTSNIGNPNDFIIFKNKTKEYRVVDVKTL